MLVWFGGLDQRVVIYYCGRVSRKGGIVDTYVG